MAARFRSGFCPLFKYKLIVIAKSTSRLYTVSSCKSLVLSVPFLRGSLLSRTALKRTCSSNIIISRHLTNGDKSAEAATDYIPSPPVPPVSQDTADIVTSVLEEPSLVSQGLGGWSPVGLLQNVLDWLHLSVGLPWWASVCVATLLVRIFVFPLFIKAQRNAALLNNHMPQIQALQLKMTQARQNGNNLEMAKYSNELMEFMKEKNCNPMKSMIVPLAQAPVFISFFIALRRMANLPIESFKYGGALWFTDLTIPDPYYILPLITSVTLFITIEIGAEGGMRMDQMETVRYFLRAIPVVMFPFIMHFPAAILCYWVSTNGITLMQVGLLKIPKVRAFFKIQERIQHTPETLPIKKKGFVDSVKESYSNMKVTRDMESRMQADVMKFRKAGMGPVPKTYKFDPTKQKS